MAVMVVMAVMGMAINQHHTSCLAQVRSRAVHKVWDLQHGHQTLKQIPQTQRPQDVAHLT